MQHLAIMKKAWGLTELIAKGEKTIETRWYQNRAIPWKRINPGEQIYFKDSGTKVSVVATVEKVEFLTVESEKQRREIITRVWQNDLANDRVRLPLLMNYAKGKKYAIIIYLEQASRLADPFAIDKKGFGSQASWLIVNDITDIKI